MTVSAVPRATDSSRPESDLAPPDFARRALTAMVAHRKCVRLLIANGMLVDAEHDKVITPTQYYAGAQDDTHALDMFVHAMCALVAKDAAVNGVGVDGELCGQCLQPLLTSLVRTAQAHCTDEQLKRLVRSVIRVYALLHSVHTYEGGKGGGAHDAKQSVHEPYSTSAMFRYLHRRATRPPPAAATTGSSKAVTGMAAVFDALRAVLRTLKAYSVVELAALADACMAPVRVNFMQPTLAQQQQQTVMFAGQPDGGGATGDFWERTGRMLAPQSTVSEEKTDAKPAKDKSGQQHKMHNRQRSHTAVDADMAMDAAQQPSRHVAVGGQVSVCLC